MNKYLVRLFFKFDDGVDDGPVLDQVTIENTPSLTIAQAGELIEHEWVKRVPKLWKDFCSGKLVAENRIMMKLYIALREENLMVR
jgi:hypothetical protein